MPDERIIGEHYRVEGVIGQGGMGTVYRGVDMRTQLPVAIKELKQELIKVGSDTVQRFGREAEALRKLNHPNIVKVLASVEEAGHYYIVMEYVSGGALDDLLQETPQLPVDRVLDIALDLADALTRAHRLKIIHRDIKPANVLVREDGSPLLTDFGVARIGNTTRMTEVGVVVGTLAYLPPEALRGEAVDERLDIWAFGVMLYEMVAGIHPFYSEATGALLMNILNQPAPDLFHYRSDIPWTLMGLIYWMLEKDPAARPVSVRLIGAMLENIMSGTAIPLEWFGDKGRTPPLDSGTPRPNPEEAMRAVMEYTTASFRLESGKSPTPEPTDAVTVVDVVAEPPPLASPTGTLTGIVDGPATNRGLTLPVLPARRVSIWLVWTLAVGLAGLALLVLIVQPKPVILTDPSTSVPATEVIFVEPVGENEGMALVAQFEHISGEERDASRFIVENLKRVIEEDTPYSDVRIRVYPAVIRDADTALRVAEEFGATVIIWGSYDVDGITANIQLGSLAKSPNLMFERTEIEKILNVQVTTPNERRETLAYNVIAMFNGLASFNGDAFAIGRNLLVLKSLPDTPATVQGNSIAARYHRFIRSYIDDPATSIAEVTEAVRLDANNPMLYAARALAYQRLGEMDKSRQDTETAERFAGKDWVSALMLHVTDAFFIMSDYPQAYDYLDQLMEKRPDDWYPLAFRGIASYMMGDYTAAEADFRASIALKPEINFPYTFAIAVSLRRGDVLAVQALFKEVLERFPDPTLAENILKVTLNSAAATSPLVSMSSAFGNVTLRRWEDVLANTQPAVDMNMDLADPYFLRGIAYCNLKQYKEAEASYTRALEIDDSFSLVYLMRADVRQKQQNLIGAATDLTTAMSRPEMRWLQPAFTLDKLGDIDCKSFLDMDFADLMGTAEATP